MKKSILFILIIIFLISVIHLYLKNTKTNSKIKCSSIITEEVNYQNEIVPNYPFFIKL